MTYCLLGAFLGLVGFAGVNLLVSALVAAGCRFGTRLLPTDPAPRAWSLLALRLAPAALSIAFTAALVVPAYLRFEPRTTSEPIAPALFLLALPGAGLLAGAVREGVRSLRATRRLVREWLARGRPVVIQGSPVRAYRFPHAFPVVAVVGVLRPRLFVASAVLEDLEPGERAAVLAHEASHLRGRDNLKRVILSGLPDWLTWTPVGAKLRRAWEEAAEAAADDQAARTHPGAAVDLASALVKVGRMAPPGSRLDVPATALHTGADLGCRVRRLLAGPQAHRSRRPRPPEAALLVGLVAGTAAVAAWAAPQRLVHGVLEAVVRLLT